MPQYGGSWSESKLKCVEDYARAYLRVMQNQPWAVLHYVDAFAGPGWHPFKRETPTGTEIAEVESFFGSEEDRADAKSFREGSALRAFGASASSDRQFDWFKLIDAHEPSCRELEETIGIEYPEMLNRVDVECGDANIALEAYIESVDWNVTRSLVFLDPFGLEVRWNTIEKLAGTEACDVWYLFPLGGVIRMMTGSGQIPDSWRGRLDELFGTSGWYKEFYPTTQATLFNDEASIPLRDASPRHILDYIHNRLLTIFPAVSQPGVLRNSKGFPLFALVLGVANPGQAAQDAALRIGNHLVKGLEQ